MRPRGAHLKHAENNSTMDLIGMEEVASLASIRVDAVLT